MKLKINFHYHIISVSKLHVISCTYLNDDVLSVVYWDRIYGGLDGPEIGGAINIDRDEAVADGSDPFVGVLG